MQVYAIEVSRNSQYRARCHMLRKTYATGEFKKADVERFAIKRLGIPARMQTRDEHGRFGKIVYPADRFADRMIQTVRKRGKLTKGKRVGNLYKWHWKD